MGSRSSTIRPSNRSSKTRSKLRAPASQAPTARAPGSRAPESPPAQPTVLVGRVRRPHGVRGEVLVEVLSDVAERFAPGSELLVGRPRAKPGSEAALEGRLVVAATRGHRGDLLVRFEGLEDRGAAEELQGALLEIERSAAAQPSDGEYFHYQLLGCRCRDRRSGDLGEVVDLIEDGGGLILVVEGAGRRVPVPFVASFLVEIDVGAGQIELDLPPGLVETCAFES